MIITMRNSSLYVAMVGTFSELDSNSNSKRVDEIFDDIFEGSATRVSYVRVENDCEIIYEIPTPIIQDDTMVKEFFCNLEVLLEELKEHNPHFTQFKRGDVSD